MNLVVALIARISRLSLLLALVAIGALMLTRYAPGYFSDVRELDAQHSQTTRISLDAQKRTDRSALQMMHAAGQDLLRGNLGQSRQYGVPVTELLKPRLLVTASLVLRGMTAGFLLAFALALPLSAARAPSSRAAIGAACALLLAIPIGALATFFLLADTGGPVLALAILTGARDFKFLYRLVAEAWRMPCLLHARAQGISVTRIAFFHLLPSLWLQLTALATFSFVMALSAAVPVEVLFDTPGIGQLAWNAAMNRDSPVLLAVTLGMAFAVGLPSLFAGSASGQAQLFEAA